MGSRHGNAQDGVRAELTLVFGSVQLQQDFIQTGLIHHVHADDRRSDDIVDVVDGFPDALSAVALLVAVAQFHRFVDAGAGAGRNDRSAHGVVVQPEFDFYGRIASAVQDFSCVYFIDACHKTYLRLVFRCMYDVQEIDGIETCAAHQGSVDILHIH